MQSRLVVALAYQLVDVAKARRRVGDANLDSAFEQFRTDDGQRFGVFPVCVVLGQKQNRFDGVGRIEGGEPGRAEDAPPGQTGCVHGGPGRHPTFADEEEFSVYGFSDTGDSAFQAGAACGLLALLLVDRGEAAALRGEVFELPAIQLARRRVFAGDDQHGKILLKPTTVLFLVAM